MSLRKVCPCDISGICPYDAEYFGTCEHYCGADEPQDDYYGDWDEEEDIDEE